MNQTTIIHPTLNRWPYKRPYTMNTPNPVPPLPATDPTAAKTAASLPTLGGILGSFAGVYVATKLGLNPADPVTGGAVVGSVAGLFTAIFHTLAVKLKAAASA